MTADTDLIGQGTDLFNGAYSLAKTAGFPAMVGAAMGLIADLPKSQLQAGISAAAGLANAAEGGAAAGAVLGPYGAAIGAAVGAIIDIVSLALAGTPPAPPEGEFRTLAERYCFPARGLGGNTVATASEVLAVGSLGASQVGVLPASWPNIRQQVISYQETNAKDPISGVDGPLGFQFTTGWVPTPFSTSTTTGQAMSLAQAWIAQNNVTKFLLANKYFQNFGLNANQALITGAASSLVYAAQTQAFSGIQADYDAAIALVNRWYGSTFTVPPWSVTNNMGTDGKWIYPTNVSALDFVKTYRKNVLTVNATTPGDYIYYLSEPFVLENNLAGNPQVVLPIAGSLSGGALASTTQAYEASAVSFESKTALQMVALPDTLLVGVCELACYCVANNLKGATADLLAFHYVLSSCWLWWRGMTQDISKSRNPLFSWMPVTLHPNFARVLGILAGLTKQSVPAAFAGNHTSTVKTTLSPAVSTLVSGGSGSAIASASSPLAKLGAAVAKTTVMASQLAKLVPATAVATPNEIAKGVSLVPPSSASPLTTFPRPASPTPAASAKIPAGVAIATVGAVALGGAILLTRHHKH
jgi:hypothetical protein